MDVCVQVFSFAEPPELLEATMDAYADLLVPRFVDDIFYQAAITPARGEVTSYHPRAARDHPEFELVITPDGKLPSRNYGHSRAVQDLSADVVVAADADAPPVRDDYLEQLLEPLRDRGVLATTGVQYDDNPLTFWFTHLGYGIDLFVNRPLYGRSSAITTEGWQVAGPFRDVDDSYVHSVRAEEEFAFRDRLEDHGEIRVVPDARVYSNLRRFTCHVERQWGKVGRHVSPWCQKHVGQESFHPRQR